MPTAYELVDNNRAIVARINRRRHHSSQFNDEDDENPLMSTEDQEATEDSNDSVTEHIETLGQDHLPYENLSRGRRTSGGGKWPRQKYIFNSSSSIKSGYRKRNCHAKNCVHQFGSSCTDVLLQPHLFPHICKNKGKKQTC